VLTGHGAGGGSTNKRKLKKKAFNMIRNKISKKRRASKSDKMVRVRLRSVPG